MPQMSKVELYAAIRRDYRGGMAMRHHISVSYLHRIFQGEDITVSSWIREQRLAHARRDLAGPTLRSTPIHEIASRWGFPRAADFSQAFRNACGIPPQELPAPRHRPG
jgi:AraC-like DNA-binding protein